MANFEKALRAELEARPRLGISGRLIRRVLDMRPSKKRERILKRLEAHARTTVEVEAPAALAGAKAGSAIDWSKVDWSKVFDMVLKVIVAILPLLLAA